MIFIKGLCEGLAPVASNTNLNLFIIDSDCRPVNRKIMLTCCANLLGISGNHYLLPLQILPSGQVSIHDVSSDVLSQIHWINLTASYCL
jgi:hypothetical protein